jgi:hypothetical protein
MGILVALAIAGGIAAGARAPESVLDPPQPKLGERATLTLPQAPVDSTRWPVGVGVILRPGSDPRTFEAMVVRVGQVGVVLDPAQPDTLWWNVPVSIEQAAPELLRDIKHVDPIHPNWLPTALAVALLLAGPVWWLLRRLRRRERRQAAFAIPVEPPHHVALRRLDEIARSGCIEREEFDWFFVEASHALRTYIGGRYRVPVLDWTSAEVVSKLREAGYEKHVVTEVGPLLREADDVKFAAGRPTPHAAERWLERARDWIVQTAVEPVFSTPEALRAAELLTSGRSPR